jgi:hypothetical protein
MRITEVKRLVVLFMITFYYYTGNFSIRQESCTGKNDFSKSIGAVIRCGCNFWPGRYVISNEVIKRMKTWKPWLMIAAIALPLALGGATAYGFQDTQGDPAEADINALAQAGVINGINDELFDPKGIMTLAQGVQLIVRALDLNIDALRFIKEPVASDYFDHVARDAWYAKAMIIAFHNGLSLPRDTDPNARLTEGEFVQLLKEGLRAKTEADFSGLFTYAADSTAPLTRSKAAKLAAQAMAFLHAPQQDQQHQPVTVTRTKVAEGVDQVTLTWPERPTTGYSVRIEGIDFRDAKAESGGSATGGSGSSGGSIAVIRYSLHKPAPDSINAQVVTDAKATTYVAANCSIELLLVK